MATDVVSWVTSLLIGFLLSHDLIPKVSGWSEQAENATHRIQVVDNDPEFLVGAKGMDKPFCFHLESPENDVIRLLQDPITGIIVNARVFHDRLTNKSYLGTILVGGVDINVLARQNDLLINDRQFNWQNMNADSVKGHRVVVAANMVAVSFRKKQITLIVRRHFVTKETDDDFSDNETSDTDDSGRGDSPLGGSRKRRREAIKPFRENMNQGLKVEESSYILNTINKLSSTKNAEKNVVDFMSKRHLQHNKRHGGHHRRRHRKLRGKRYENSHFRPGRERPRRVPAYNEVIQSGHHTPFQSTQGNTVYLGVYISDSRDFSNKTHGLLGQFLFKNVTMERMNYKNGRVKAKFIIDQNPKRRTIALLSLRKNVALNTTRACWRVRHQGRDVIDGSYRDYVVPIMMYTKMMELPPSNTLLPTPVTTGPRQATSATPPMNPEEMSSTASSTTTPAPPTYPTCVYETHHRVEPVGSKTNPNPVNGNPYFIATSSGNNVNNNNLLGNNEVILQGGHNNNVQNNHINRSNNRNGWMEKGRLAGGGSNA